MSLSARVSSKLKLKYGRFDNRILQIFESPSAYRIKQTNPLLDRRLVPITRRVVFRANHQSSSLLGSAVDGLHDVYELLLIFQHPIEFVVISGPKIAHHVFVSEEKHDCHGVV